MMMVFTCWWRRVLMMAPALVTRGMVSAVVSMMLTTGLILGNQRPAQ